MKIKGSTKHETLIEGEISLEEIVGFIRGQLQLPADSGVEVFVRVPGGGDWSNAELNIAESPLRFLATVSGTTPLTVTPPPAPPEQAPVCSVPGCQFPSLSGGMCPSHLSEAYRTQNTAGQMAAAEQAARSNIRYPR